MLRDVFFSLLTNFSIGLLFTVLFISLEEIGQLFFRVTSLISLALILFALAAQPFPDLTHFAFLDLSSAASWLQRLTFLALWLACAALIVFNLMHPRLHKSLLVAACLVGLFAISCYSVEVFQTVHTSFSANLLYVLSGIGSALVLGSVLGAMITGHWYLVQHKLSLTPLKSSSKVYLIAVALRTLLIIGLGFSYLFGNADSQFVEHLSQMDFTGYLILSRVAFGLVIPFIFGIMVWQATKIRSTQSATGILYATIVLVLIGETFGKYLFYAIGVLL